MPAPSLEARRLGERFQLAPRFRGRRGLPGERLGRGIGSSLEFLDRRSYEVGDDVRHLDWRAYARTDQLLVKQYEEELRPRLELFLDLSRSLAVEEAKFALAVDLAGVLLEAARRAGFETVLLGLGDEPRPLDVDSFFESGAVADSTLALPRAIEQVGDRLRAGSLRVVVSDFLVPHAPGSYFPWLARSAGRSAFVQVLGLEDVAPPHDPAGRLVDSETGRAWSASSTKPPARATWNVSLVGTPTSRRKPGGSVPRGRARRSASSSRSSCVASSWRRGCWSSP